MSSNWTEAEVLGGTVWLWISSEAHRDLPLHSLPAAVLPAIKRRQFVLASEEGKPVFFASWALMNEEAEKRFLETHQLLMKPEDWSSGDRFWFIDWVAPFGHSKACFDICRNDFFKGVSARSLYHKGHQQGRRVQYFFGSDVSKSDRKDFRHKMAQAIE